MALQLRLRLASYKIRTNQIDIPMDRLQIKTTGNSPRLPVLPRANTSKRRHPLPSTATTLSNIPNIRLQRPSSANEKSTTDPPQEPDLSSSPPAPHRSSSNSNHGNSDETDTPPTPPSKDTGDVCDGFATPLLPKQREGSLHPPLLGTPLGDDRKSERELTSSVVKGRAADGLLSLMRQG